MITEYQFLYTLLIFYMLINLYTDFRFLKTKNVWHLTISIIGLSYAVMNGLILIALKGLLVSLVFSLLLSKIPKSDFGAGDIKMLLVSSVLLVLMKPEQSTLNTLFTFTSLYFFQSFLIIFFLQMIRTKAKLSIIKFGAYRITKKYIETPEAVPFFIVCLLAPII